MIGGRWLSHRLRRGLWTLCVLLIVAFAGAKSNIAGKLKTALLRHGIIPEIMMQAPKLGIYVAFGKKYAARFGNLIPIEMVDKPPTTMKWKTTEDSVYTVIALDLDAIPKAHRADETEVERLLWLVVNIPASDAVKVAEGKTLAPYIAPTLDPIKGVDHRILFMVFEQTGGKMNFTFPVLDAKPDDPRRNEFNVHEFVKGYKLYLPVALNFYVTREGILEAEKTVTAPGHRKQKRKQPKGAEGGTTTVVYLDVTAERINYDEEAVEIEYV